MEIHENIKENHSELADSQQMNENLKEDDEMFGDSTHKSAQNFKNSRKLSIFGKSSFDSRKSEFTLSTPLDANDEYEKSRNEEIDKWFMLVSQAKNQYLMTKAVEPHHLTIDDLPDQHKNFLKEQMDYYNTNAHSAVDIKFQDVYLEFVQGVKQVEAKKNFVYDYLKSLKEVKAAETHDKLFS